jgi:hypothetical protein
MSKLNERLTLVANLSVVVGIAILAIELRQNTQAIQAQTRDAITDKQMELSSWFATSPELAAVWAKANTEGMASLTPQEFWMVTFARQGIFREWENSYYQYEQGLFTPEDFASRRERWVRNMSAPLYHDWWEGARDQYSPGFRAEIDSIVAELDRGGSN